MKQIYRRLLDKAFGRVSDFAWEEAAYRRLLAKGFVPDAIIDVGAYEGKWTRMARRVFGEIPCLMVEAQPGKKAVLDQVCRELSFTSYASAALGATSGEIATFYQMETGSSFFAEQSSAPRKETRLTTQTLDQVAQELSGTSLFLKLDVQGGELSVLAGGQKTLARANVVQLEVAMLPYNSAAPTFLEVISYMDEHGFVPLDISGESRPNGYLVQIDLTFTQRESPLRPKFIRY